MESKQVRDLLKIAILLAVIALFSSTGCASSKRYRFDIMKKKESCDMAHMGKNKYFYSNHYQKILKSNERRISGRNKD